jgi:hypothetical protein
MNLTAGEEIHRLFLRDIEPSTAHFAARNELYLAPVGNRKAPPASIFMTEKYDYN